MAIDGLLLIAFDERGKFWARATFSEKEIRKDKKQQQQEDIREGRA